MPLWIEVKVMAEKEVKNQKLLKELIASSNLQEDKLTTARVVANQDSQKAANAIKSLMKKKWPKNRNSFSLVL